MSEPGIELPWVAGGFAVIYADPPWRFEVRSDKGKGRSPEAYYDTMSLEDICALRPARVAAADAVLLMWCTEPLLKRGLQVIEAWGFEYKTFGFTWVKTRGDALFLDPTGGWHFGTGYWTRANPEICLLATRGAPKRLNADVPELVVAPVGRHSQKPAEVYERIERLVAGPYLELFARNSRPGWSSWGNQVDSGPGARRWSSDGGPG